MRNNSSLKKDFLVSLKVCLKMQMLKVRQYRENLTRFESKNGNFKSESKNTSTRSEEIPKKN